MTPYYQDSAVTIYHGRMEDVLPLPVDVVVTDPPYGISDEAFRGPARTGKRTGQSNGWHPVSEWDGKIDSEWCVLSCASAPVVAWFGHWRKRPEVEASMPHPIRAEIVWAKDCHVGPPCPVAMRDERIWIFSAAGIEGRRFETSVWDERIIPTWAHKFHKNEKPLNLIVRLLSWLPVGVVLDPFMGSGTTLRAAKDLGREAVGVDTSERNCEIAAKRMSKEVLSFKETI